MSLLEKVEETGSLLYTEAAYEIIAGPETAARLGVPVGTVVEMGVTREYTSRARQRWWNRLHPGGRFVFRPTTGKVI